MNPVRPRELWGRYAAGTGLRELRELDRRISSLADAVEENTLLAGDLEEQIAELEGLVLRVAEELHGRLDS